jgi:hypothetical protein
MSDVITARLILPLMVMNQTVTAFYQTAASVSNYQIMLTKKACRAALHGRLGHTNS